MPDVDFSNTLPDGTDYYPYESEYSTPADYYPESDPVYEWNQDTTFPEAPAGNPMPKGFFDNALDKALDIGGKVLGEYLKRENTPGNPAPGNPQGVIPNTRATASQRVAANQMPSASGDTPRWFQPIQTQSTTTLIIGAFVVLLLVMLSIRR